MCVEVRSRLKVSLPVTRTILCLCAFAAGMPAACLRIETVADQHQSTAAFVPSVIFDTPLPPIPKTMALYQMQPGEPPDHVRKWISRRCPEACTPNDDPGSNRKVFCAEPTEPTSHKPSQALVAQRATSMQTEAVKDPEGCKFGSGDDHTVQIYPRFRRMTDRIAIDKPSSPAERLEAARAFLRTPVRPDGLAHDQRRFGEGRVLSRAVLRAGSKDSAPEDASTMLLFASSQRRIDRKYRVDGPGSRMSVMIDGANEAEGLMFNWNQPVSMQALEAGVDAAKLQAEITRQLLDLGARTNAHVTNIELIYYDGDNTLLQPVFRYLAEFSADKASVGHTEHIVGYVPYAKTAEPLPRLARSQADDPSAQAQTPPIGIAAEGKQQSTASFGVFIVRHDKKSWLDNAVGFETGLRSAPLAARLQEVHFFAAMPEQFTTAYQQYINGVDVALVEAHGVPGAFATLQNNQAFVAIGNTSLGFPSSGYGPKAQGRLRHWAIHSCDVLAHPQDVSWRNVFKGGLQTIVGYRTPMYITDGASELFARHLGSGAPVIAAWFAAVNSLNVYQLDPSVHSRCDGNEAIGRPAAISVCGAEDATVLDASDLSSDCLQVWNTLDALEQ